MLCTGNNTYADGIRQGQRFFSLPLFFLLQAACESFAKQNNQLVQHLVPVTVPLCPFLWYVPTGKIKHFFQSGVTWEYALCFCEFSVLAVQSFYDICCVHDSADIIRKLEKRTYIFPVIFPVTDGIRILLPPPHVSLLPSSSARAASLVGALYTALKSDENFLRSL